MSDMYLTLFENENGSAVDVGISIADAMSYTEKDFADLYRRTVYKSSRKEAKAWAKRQVEARAFIYQQAAQMLL